MAVSRRAALALGGVGALVVAGGAGVGLVETDVLPGRIALNRRLGACAVSVPAGAEPGPVLTSTLDSRRRGRPVDWRIGYPPGHTAGTALPVCLVLHGYSGSAVSAFDGLHVDRHLAAAVRDGCPPFAVAAVDGGDRYWHPRADGDDPMGMVLDEFLPMLAGRGLRTERTALLGWSMGGYGALLFATRQPGRFAAVGALSPAVFSSYADARANNPTGFDSAADWTRYDIWPRLAALRGVPVQVSCGRTDGFAGTARRLAHDLPAPASVHIGPGCHDESFWQSAVPGHLAAIGRALQST